MSYAYPGSIAYSRGEGLNMPYLPRAVKGSQQRMRCRTTGVMSSHRPVLVAASRTATGTSAKCCKASCQKSTLTPIFRARVLTCPR